MQHSQKKLFLILKSKSFFKIFLTIIILYSFSKIPESIYELCSLEILNLRNNQLTEILVDEDTLKKLKRLATLDLANNNIQSIPLQLGTMKQIT